MSATGEAEVVTTEQPTAEVAAAEQPQPVEKPVKEKKPKVPKEKKPKTPKVSSHPPYFQVIQNPSLYVLN